MASAEQMAPGAPITIPATMGDMKTDNGFQLVWVEAQGVFVRPKDIQERKA